MSGTAVTFAYGDRPLAMVRPNGGAYATTEFLQYLQRLTASHNSIAGGAGSLQTQVNTNTGNIATLSGEVSILTTAATTSASTDVRLTSQVNSLINRVPIQITVAAGSAIALTSGSVAQIATDVPTLGLYILSATLYLTGAGSATIAQASVGVNAGVIETAPGAFATAWFGAGASPTTLGVDLTVSGIMQLLRITVPGALYFNARATIVGAISAYGSMTIWRVND